MSAEKKATKRSVSILQSWKTLIDDKRLIFPTSSIVKATEKVQEALKSVYVKKHS